MSEHMNAHEVAEMFLVKRDTVLGWARKGILPAFRIPGARGDFRFHRSEMEKLINGAKVIPNVEDEIDGE